MPRRKQRTVSRKSAVGARKGATAAACGQHLTLSRQRVSQMADEGTLPRNGDGSFDLDACRNEYIAFLRSEDRRGAKSAAVSRVQDARAREIEIRTAREEGRLVPMESVSAAIIDILGTYRSELNGVAAASTRDLTLRAEVQRHLDGAIDRCRERFERADRKLAKGADPLEDEE